MAGPTIVDGGSVSAVTMGRVRADPEPLPAVCPVSMLPILARPEWVYTNPERTYRTTIALIGETIFWVIPRGYVTEADMAAATALAADILADVHPSRTPFVFIENFAHTKGGTAGARRRYLQFTNTLEGLLGAFPYGMPSFFRFSFNFSRRLHLHRYRVHMVARYADAVEAALDLLDHRGIFAGAPVAQPAHPFSGRPSHGAGDGWAADQTTVSDATQALTAAEALLDYLGRLDLASAGTPEPSPILRRGPLQPVCEALALLKLDVDLYLDEHQALMADLQNRQHQLLDKSAAIEHRNRQLQTLLQQSSQDQAAFGKTVRHNVETLLKPILELIRRDAPVPSRDEALERTAADLDVLIEDLFPRLDLHDYGLTPREMRIARLIRDGEQSEAIARRLGLSLRTVESFRRRLREKLGLRGRPRNLRTVLQALPED